MSYILAIGRFGSQGAFRVVFIISFGGIELMQVKWSRQYLVSPLKPMDPVVPS